MEKDCLTITKKHRMENSQNRNGKNKSTNNINELNEVIYAGAKFVCEKIGVPSKSTKKKIKTWMENLTGNTDKKSMKTGQNNKTWNM